MGNFYSYWRNLTKPEREVYAMRVGLSYEYLDNHVIHRRKIPHLNTLEVMAKESDGILNLHGLVDFFTEKNSKADQT